MSLGVQLPFLEHGYLLGLLRALRCLEKPVVSQGSMLSLGPGLCSVGM